MSRSMIIIKGRNMAICDLDFIYREKKEYVKYNVSIMTIIDMFVITRILW